jgi:hypothetical protein
MVRLLGEFDPQPFEAGRTVAFRMANGGVKLFFSWRAWFATRQSE